MTIQAEILKREDQLLEAIKSSNIISLDKLLHNDSLFIMPDGKAITKQMDLAAHRSGAMVVEALKPTIEQINLIESIAVIIVVYETKGKMLRKHIQGRFRYIRISNSFDGDWKVIGGSCIQI